MEISALVAVDFGSLIGIMGLSGIFESSTTTTLTIASRFD